jgi:hypothetical protein
VAVPTYLSIHAIYPVSLLNTLLLSISEVGGVSALSFIHSFCCFYSCQKQEMFLSSRPSRLAVGHMLSRILRKNFRAVALPTYLPLVLMLRTNAAIPPLQHTPPRLAMKRLPVLVRCIYILILVYQYV